MLSIIIVTNDKRPGELEQCLKALRRQTVKNFEVIIVHPCVTQKVSTLDEHVINVWQSGKGICNARNCGIDAAKGDIIVFTDDDAEPQANWLAKIQEKFQQHPELSYLGGDFKCEPQSVWQKWVNSRYHLSSKQTCLGLCHGNNMAYRREVFDTVRFNESIIFGYDEAELQTSLRRLNFKSDNFSDIVVKHQHRSTFKLFTLSRISYAVGKIQAYKALNRELFGFEDMLNFAFFASLFYLIFNPSLIIAATTIILIISIFFKQLIENIDNTSLFMLLIDVYASLISTTTKILQPIISKVRKMLP